MRASNAVSVLKGGLAEAAKEMRIGDHGAGPARETENRTTLQKSSELPAQEDSIYEQR